MQVDKVNITQIVEELKALDTLLDVAKSLCLEIQGKAKNLLCLTSN